MPKLKLTDAAVQRLEAPPGARVEYFDVTMPGFGIRVSGKTPRTPDGRRSWILFYRYGGEQRRLTLEPGYPAMKLADARRKAGDALALVSVGKDPAAEREDLRTAAARKPDTVENVVEEFIRRGLEGKRRAPRYIDETRRNFSNHVLPRWADRDIRSITRRDVIALLDDVNDNGSEVRSPEGKRKSIPGGPICANRVLAAVRALFNWCLRRGMVDAVPTSLVEKPGQESRRDRALGADEITAVWRAAEQLAYPMGAFFQLALLTGQRRDEVAGMRWADIDLKARTWTLAASATKAGRAHVVPLSAPAIDLLRSLPRIGTTYVLTTAGKVPVSGFSVGKRRLDKAIAAARLEAGLPDLEGWRIHDLRRTAATEMGRLGFSRLVISRVLNHADTSVTAIYDRHSYLEEKRAALEAWATFVQGLTSLPMRVAS